MKTFFDGVFMSDAILEAANIKYPIKLEYYKTIDIEEDVGAKYGIEIVKTEYKKGDVKIERKIVSDITTSTAEANKILTILRNNEVTPIGMQDVLNDILAISTYKN